ncbi:MAG TPA: serine/threonine-protein kinase [Polyangiales bacterium]|nr:serine/threonine-protein kinase [Polyangiales bacterium]
MNPPDTSVPLGTVLDGRYRIHALLGMGGMGQVYAAEDLRLGRQVAVKVVRQIHDEQMLGERLFREAKAAARAEHPAVVTAFGYGTDPDLSADYFVMERLHGETVGQRIDSVGPLPIALVLRIAIETCDALIAVHDAGVIHRDLKPNNIFLASRGQRTDEIKLLDFGVAKQLNLQTLTATGQIWGTPTYMAPEQLADSKRVDPRCDLYSLGVVLYECLTGKLPFTGSNVLALTLAVMQGADHDLRAQRADVPAELAAIVERCMRKERDERFAEARALYRALGRVVL